ncbi:MAG: acyl-ACP--UDP-N-acetylglucosamine O-acyltransferase [Desulfobacula sp.]|jgi:UDP-N-acetylglucosamine acyltransferase|uniref:acyl-ACP--UDP-N-acetylglucosamine O-acyltransferase n=1 Tax=Desulfobacula sp. TaxID=2593537 RepID=UPI001D9036C0|nr:acyl-ACP--UDP-N-acetylglucosamine O-acyltransferase [Desulfobacula sp.]MBT3484441.1 acyl-ACP--UDP-N-acetylglucosamine O-acyltransferase [Desulfobacula sp.]MBT3803356.1 acyl-ACP--UDP-N-acetylglucosamine O-acyltransferase [Desulfobacula sp.]MBT4023677.1 acyl-ACP--UDP-N-acetylglucosamine O-acyltransferase [Desulfobacula sp.]MBT4197919.1 acyl-ACP--UDP-N-acetylglucosamine O-acyltransferase [Desulfobacula sp.]
MIHPTAIIDPCAQIDANVTIGPYAIIKSDVHIGSGTTIGPYTTIEQYVTIGENCQIFQYAAIGCAPQDLKFHGEKTYLKIGKGSIIREFVTINRGTEAGGGVTEVGEENYLMAYTHIAHDCKTGRQVILANNSTLAGHIIIGDNVTVGGLVAIHQFVQIGDFAYIGGKSAVVKDIPPYVIAAGDRATLHGLNNVGLKRHKFPKSTLQELKKAYRIFFRIGLTVKQASERVKAETEQIPEVKNFIKFIINSNRGVTR